MAVRKVVKAVKEKGTRGKNQGAVSIICAALFSLAGARQSITLESYEGGATKSIRSSVSGGFDSLNVKFVGNWPFGYPNAVILDPERKALFLGLGGGVYILDISNPENPVKISEAIHTRGTISNLYYFNNKLYIAAQESGIDIWDVSSLNSPQELGSYVTPDYAYSLAVSGSYCYVTGDTFRIRVVDVSKPYNPKEVGFYDTPGHARGIVVAGSYAYVADGKAGLRVLDISNPKNPTEVGFCVYDTLSPASALTVAGSYCYIVDGGSSLRVIDVSNPRNPTAVGFCATLTEAHDVVISGSYCYIADGPFGLGVVNVSNPRNPEQIASYNYLQIAYAVAVSGSHCYVAEVLDIPSRTSAGGSSGSNSYQPGWSGLGIIDVSNPHSPKGVGFYETPGWYVCAVAVSGSHCFLGDYDGGLRIIDISNLQSPRELGFYDTPHLALDVAVSGFYCYVADQPMWGSSGSLRIVDISNPQNPKEVGFYNIPDTLSSYVSDVKISGSYCYVAGYSGLWIIDISDPKNPMLAAVYKTTGEVHSVAVSGSYCYVADGYAGLLILDISNPRYPRQVGLCDTPGEATDVVVSDSYCYVANGGAGLRIIDVTDPQNPKEVGFYEALKWPRGIVVSGSYCFVADDWNGLRILDISHPPNLKEIGFYETPGVVDGVAVSDSFCYVAADYHGFQIYQKLPIGVEEETKPSTGGKMILKLKPVRTGFRVESSLTQTSKVALFLIDCTGRIVEQENLGRKDGGTQAFFLNMAGIANGVYFVRLTDGAHKATAKAVWVR